MRDETVYETIYREPVHADGLANVRIVNDRYWLNFYAAQSTADGTEVEKILIARLCLSKAAVSEMMRKLVIETNFPTAISTSPPATDVTAH